MSLTVSHSFTAPCGLQDVDDGALAWRRTTTAPLGREVARSESVEQDEGRQVVHLGR